MLVKPEDLKSIEDKKRNDMFPKQSGRDVIAKLKNYNKDILKTSQAKPLAKNRAQQPFALPPQIQANLPNVNLKSDKQLLKEKANRYTWEDRLVNFSLLKKIDKKVVDKKLCMSFSDYKKMLCKND